MSRKDKKLEGRVNRFLACNSRMREKTLESEQTFLKLAGNISNAQLQVLLSIGDNAPCPMSTLAKKLHFSKANMTQMVDRLVRNRFVKKIKCKEDKRIVEVMLLKKGLDIHKLHQEHVERVARGWFQGMSEKEQEAILAVWEKYLK